MYAMLMVWEETHRGLLWGIAATVLWLASYGYYLRGDIRGYFKRRAAQRWAVDMATRTVTAGRKPVQ